MDELVLLPRLDHPASAHKHGVRTVGVGGGGRSVSGRRPSPVGAELAGDVQHVHHALQLQLPTAYRRGDEAAGAADPRAAGEQGGWWVSERSRGSQSGRAVTPCGARTCSGR